MDHTYENHRQFLRRDRQVPWRDPQAAPCTELDHPRALQVCGDNQITEPSVIRAASGYQAHSSDIHNDDNFNSPMQERTPETLYGHSQVTSSPTYGFHEDTEYDGGDTDHPCHNGGPIGLFFPQMDHNAYQMNSWHPRDSQPSGTNWSPAYELYNAGPFPRVHMSDIEINPAPGFSVVHEGDHGNTSYPNLAFNGNQNQRSHVSQPQQGSVFRPCEAPPHLGLRPDAGASHNMVVPNKNGFWSTATDLVTYPNMGYELTLQMHEDPADSQETQFSKDGEEPYGSDFVSMLNYSRLSSILPSQLLSPPPPLAEGIEAELPPASETSSENSQEPLVVIWDSKTGESVQGRPKRCQTGEEHANSQVIRNRGGACARCKTGKRKCNVSHIQSRSETSTASPSTKTCSESDSSFVHVTMPKKRKIERLEPPREVYGQNPHRLTGRQSRGSSRHETQCETSSLPAAVSTGSQTGSARDSGVLASPLTGLHHATFSQDNIYSGEQFSGALGPFPPAPYQHCRANYGTPPTADTSPG